MGLTGFYNIAKKVPNGNRPTKLSEWRGKKWAIDCYPLLYKYLFCNQPDAHIVQFGNLVVDLMNAGITAYWVIDGKPPKEKGAVKKERETKREEHKQNISNIEDSIKNIQNELSEQEEILCKKLTLRKELETELSNKLNSEFIDGVQEIEEKLMMAKEEVQQIMSQKNEKETDLEVEKKKRKEMDRKCVIIDPKTHVRDIRLLLHAMGQIVIEAPSEGEAFCAVLNRLGYVDAGVGDDGDYFAFGGKKLIRGLGGLGNDSNGAKKRDANLVVYDLDTMLNHWGISHDQFIDFGILCGCDYTGKKKIKGIGPVNALSIVKKHTTIENYVNSLNLKQKENVPIGFMPRANIEVHEKGEDNEEEGDEEEKDPTIYDARRLFYEYSKCTQLPISINETPNDWDYIKLLQLLHSREGRTPQSPYNAYAWTKSVFTNQVTFEYTPFDLLPETIDHQVRFNNKITEDVKQEKEISSINLSNFDQLAQSLMDK